MSDDVARWLAALGLSQYSTAFEENAIDRELLPDLDQETLKDIGVKAAGHRLRLLKAAAALRRSAAASVPLPGERLGAQSVASVHGEHDLTAWTRTPGERKPVTMLFADITGSTALTEKLDAEEAHELLYGATQRMCKAVERSRGTVCRFMGDGLMAMFGAPTATEHHAVDACEAALTMQQAIREYATSTQAAGLRIRVGLHSGEVVVLSVGEGDKVEYDASGPTVPIAARMEQSATPGEVYLTAATRTLAAGRIEAEPLESIAVKGISDPVAVYALRRVRAAQELSADATFTPLIGRRAELNHFKSMLATCIEDGHGQTLYLRGEPGVGKTRLVEEFISIAAQDSVAIHRGLVLPFGVGKGQDAIRALARSLLGISAHDDDALRRGAANAALDAARLEPDQAVFLNDLLDLAQPPQERTVYDAMDNAQRNAGKQRVTCALLATAARSQPVLVVVENLNWASALTLTYLAALADTVAHCPALMVMTSRTGDDPLGPDWCARAGSRSLVTLDLQPLEMQESLALISRFIDSADPMAARCIERAAGNPLFLEQLALTTSDGGSASLPDSIQSLIVARMDRLEPEHKRALQAASVIGQRFDIELLRHLLDRHDYRCDELVARNLVRPEGSAYLFAHALIQEGVYHSILKRACRELHRAAAQWFKDDDATLFAQHLDKAGDEHAPRAYLLAAEEEVRRYHYELALDLIGQGLGLKPRAADRHELVCAKAGLLLDLGEVAAAMDLYQDASARADNDIHRFDAMLGLASCLRVSTDPGRALDLLAQCEPIAMMHGSTLGMSRLTHLRANLYFPLGNIDACREQHQRALEYARAADSPEDEARALGGLGDAEYGRGRMRSAHHALRMCIAQCDEHGFGRIAVANRSLIGNSQLFLGDCEQALNDSSAAAQAAIRVSHARAEMSALVGVCNAAFELGDTVRLEAAARRGLALAHTLEARVFESVWRGFLSAVFWLRGDSTRALDALEPAIEDKSAHSFVGAKVYGQLAMIAPDACTRSEALREGERLLGEGTIGVSHLFFYRFAIEACLYAEQWSAVSNYAQGLEDYTRDEPLPWSDFFVARGRALAAFGLGDRDEGTTKALRWLDDEAQRLGLRLAASALREALAEA